jgi:hypothetical protein
MLTILFLNNLINLSARMVDEEKDGGFVAGER